jgi:hypothetical protein
MEAGRICLNVPVGTLRRAGDFALSYYAPINPYPAIGCENADGKQRIALGLPMPIDFSPKLGDVKGLADLP